jgi:hypothetical protein
MELDLHKYAATPRKVAVMGAFASNKRSREPQPKSKRTDALMILGTGVGNVIEQTPLIKAVSTLYSYVDVFLPLSTEATASVIRGMPRVRRLYVYKSGFAKLHRRKQPYAAIFATYLVCDFAKRIKSNAVYMSGDFSVKGKSEAAISLIAAQHAGYTGELPSPWCCKEPWDHQLPGPPLIGITAGGLPTPQWRLKRYKQYADVVDFILERMPDAMFVNIGTLTDDEIHHREVCDLRGLTTLGQAATIAANCDAYIANDCGMAHVAAAVGTPTTVVFGPTRIVKNMPCINANYVTLAGLECRPCQYARGLGRRPRTGKRCNHECMKNLDPATVAEAVLAELSDADQFHQASL